MKKKLLAILTSLTLLSQSIVYGAPSTNYENSYISIVQSTLKRNKIEAIEIQFLKLASINRDDDIIKSVQSISSLDISEYLKDKNNLLSIIPDTILSNDEIIKPLEVLQTGDTKEYLNSLTHKIISITSKIDTDEFKKLSDNKKYSILLYINNTINSIALFNVKGTEAEKLFDKSFDRTKIINQLADLEGKATNELDITSGKIFSEETSAYKASSIKEALYTPYNEGSDFFISKEIVEGKALSAAYIPFRTNMDNNDFIKYVDSKTFKPFYNTYGKLRKAVFIANSKNAVTQFYLTGEAPGFKPATLRDFLEDLDREKLFVVDPGYYNSDILDNYEFQGEDKQIDYEVDNIVQSDTQTTTTSTTTEETTTSNKVSLFKPKEVYAKEVKSVSGLGFWELQDFYKDYLDVIEKSNSSASGIIEELCKKLKIQSEDTFWNPSKNKEYTDDYMDKFYNTLEYITFTPDYSSQTHFYKSILGNTILTLERYTKVSKIADKVVAIKNLSDTEKVSIAKKLGVNETLIYNLCDKVYWSYLYLIIGSGEYLLTSTSENPDKMSVDSIFSIISNKKVMDDLYSLSESYPGGKIIPEKVSATVEHPVVSSTNERRIIVTRGILSYASVLHSPVLGSVLDSVVSTLNSKNKDPVTVISSILNGDSRHKLNLQTNSFSLPSVDTLKDLKSLDIHRKFKEILDTKGSDTSSNTISNLINRNINPINLLFSNKNLPTFSDYSLMFKDTITPDSLNLYLTAMSWAKPSSKGNTLISTFKVADVSNTSNESGLGSDKVDPQDENLVSLDKFLKFYGLKTDILNSILKQLNDNKDKSAFSKGLQDYLGVDNLFDLITNGSSLSDILGSINNALKDNQTRKDEKILGSDKELDPIFQNLNSVEGLTEAGKKEFKKSLRPEAMRSIWPTYVSSDFDLRQPVATQAALLQSELLYNVLDTNVTLRIENQNTVPNEWYGVALNNDIYKDIKLLDTISGSMNKPIYRVSPNLKESSFFDATYNYLYLKNISDRYPLRYDLVNDLDMPVFVDIFGNILTYSGYVIVPFANNATMHTKIPFMNNAFLTSYGNSEFITSKYNTVDKKYYSYINNTIFDLSNERALNSLSDYSALKVSDNQDILILDEEEKKYIINPIIIETDIGNIDLSRPSVSSSQSSKVLYHIMLSAYTSEFENSLWNSKTSFINVGADMSNIYQVIRGAPMSKIDIEKEKLDASILFDDTAIDQGLKFENLYNNLSNIEYNGIISVPDFSNNVEMEQVLYLFYKLIFILIVIFVSIQIFVHAIKQRLTIFSILHIVGGSILIIILLVNIPTIHKITNYYINRALLQDEAKSIVLLNSEKSLNNSELGISEVNTRDVDSKVSLKVAEINIDKKDFFTQVFDTFTGAGLQSLYEQLYESDIETAAEDYEVRGRYLYYSVDKLFKTSTIDINTKTHQLAQHTTGTPAISFRLPYYAILDYLIYQVNTYNELLDSYQYSLINMGEGYRSQGLVERYFKGNGFLIKREDILRNDPNIPNDIDKQILDFAQYDRAGILNIYSSPEDTRDIFPNKELLKNSIWYPEAIDEQTIQELSNYLDKVAIEWVNENKDIIGRLSDETILKALALELSLAHNRYLSAPGPKYYEIDKIDSTDLLRMLILPKDKVAMTSTLSYPRMILQETGIIGIIIASFLSIIITILSLIKPLTIIASVVMFISALVIMKILLNKSNGSIFGAIKYFLLVSGINISYCLLIKLQILLTNVLPPLICLILISLIQTIYLSIYIWLICFCIRNWKDAGASELTIDKILKVKIEEKKPHSISPKEEYDKLIERDRQRDSIERSRY